MKTAIAPGYALTNCPVCGSTDYRRYCNAVNHYWSAPNHPREGYAAKHTVARCSSCGMVFTNPQQVAYNEFTAAHPVADTAFAVNWTASREQQAAVQLELLRRFVDGGRLLDFGCGNGAEVNHALCNGFDAHGYDINPGLVAAANRHWAFVRLHSGPLAEFLAKQEPWRAIISNQVFEHLPNPLDTAIALSSRLAPGGVMLIDVPYVYQPGEWLWRKGRTLDPTAHNNHFSKRTLRALLRAAGLQIVFTSAAPGFAGVWGRFMRTPNAAKVAALCKRVLPPIGTGVCVIGRKVRTHQ